MACFLGVLAQASVHEAGDRVSREIMFASPKLRPNFYFLSPGQGSFCFLFTRSFNLVRPLLLANSAQPTLCRDKRTETPRIGTRHRIQVSTGEERKKSYVGRISSRCICSEIRSVPPFHRRLFASVSTSDAYVLNKEPDRATSQDHDPATTLPKLRTSQEVKTVV